MRPVPAECLDLVHEFEQGPRGGFASVPYFDDAGFSTIGYGHKLVFNDPVLKQLPINQSVADTLAMSDLTVTAEELCNNLGSVVDGLTDGQYAALIDFTYNEGDGRFMGSTLCHFLMTNQMALVPDQFGRWIYGGGQILDGLVRRRAAEKALWLS